jgi:predicted hotdog family 3-hydroxylacyl-ACP dehydratase
MEIAVEELIPHRGRMALIEELLEVDDHSCTTVATVRQSWPLFSGNAVDVLVMVELVAQTACAGGSWKRRRDGNAAGGGWLVGIRNAEFYENRVPLHTRLITQATNQYSLDDYHVFEGTVMDGSTTICRVTIQALRNEQPETGRGEFHERE